MNNITFPESWGKKKDPYVTLKWNLISEVGNPKEIDLYIVTIKHEGIEPITTELLWNGDEWQYAEDNEVISWMKMPKPYIS